MSKRVKLDSLLKAAAFQPATKRKLPGRKKAAETAEAVEQTDNKDKGNNEKVEVKNKTVAKTNKRKSPVKKDISVKVEDFSDSAECAATTTKTIQPEKIKSTRGKRKSTEDQDAKENNGSEQWFPKNWEQTLFNIRKMRESQTAPVDEMGCHKCADDEASGPVFRYLSLVSLMLSSQTKDQVTHAAVQRLREAKKCTPESIISVPDAELEKLIYPVGFYKRKTQYLKSVAKILIEQYNSDIPKTIKDLCKLPGVGPKMAHICMQVAWNETTGIGVDTHVHRISNRLGWVQKPTKTPEDTRMALEKWLPKDLWAEVNHLLVGFGQEICQPVRPKCSECINKSICPYTGKKYEF
ncbi:endonuclease III-like protein 1 [Trichogramma pretiosum]|uniref:endonuclease III-like protein 1 n=1 Tax=Trichogramma pretiosum TaxID=7493 RepID=UPI0006C998A7|nr:endonuclease III-like protein 1 [Trichogramma pretiosum]